MGLRVSWTKDLKCPGEECPLKGIMQRSDWWMLTGFGRFWEEARRIEFRAVYTNTWDGRETRLFRKREE